MMLDPSRIRITTPEDLGHSRQALWVAKSLGLTFEENSGFSLPSSVASLITSIT